ncbi:Uncharacterised protein [Mycobacteroides abscessus subsp. abscessus]|nr:Uncharacterised protein [Mycobacteroides abscessus subsp. abscessus]
MLQPHGGALILGAVRVAHGDDVDTKGFAEPTLHIALRQVGQKCRQRGSSGVPVGGFGCTARVYHARLIPGCSRGFRPVVGAPRCALPEGSGWEIDE